jgi:15-cis-phytoene desaturase
VRLVGKSSFTISCVIQFFLCLSPFAEASSPHVIIVGGGVAGMSAAQELSERGFEVSVYERKAIPGGKARSIGKPDTGVDGRKDSPGEHGFRFFPGFYKHVTDTMSRIPFGNNVNGVFDNLVAVPLEHLARAGQAKVLLPTGRPKTLKELKEYLVAFTHSRDMYIPPHEVSFFMSRLLIYLTSSDERRAAEYDKISWFDFIDANRKSENYRKYLGIGLTRCLVASRAETASVKTIGAILIQLMLNQAGMGKQATDRVLNGPTNEVWIDPWLTYLRSLGVDYHLNAQVESIEYDAAGNQIQAVTVREDGKSSTVHGDYYVLAVPVEKAVPLITQPMMAQDPQLGRLQNLKTAWMVGIQFFLNKDVRIARAHSIYYDSAWALTSISQPQFWQGVDLSHYGDGSIRGILSVDISNWEADGNALHHKPAQKCTAQEVKEEVLAEIKMHLDPSEAKELEESVIDWALDPGVKLPGTSGAENDEPLLINTTNSWQNRPEAVTKIPNLFLAADYVRTYTDLATMEGANEAARRAVNGIIEASRANVPLCKLWPLVEPKMFSLLKKYDRWRFEHGLPYFAKKREVPLSQSEASF